MNATTHITARTDILRRFTRSAVAAGAVAAFIGMAAPAHADTPTDVPTTHAAFATPAAFTAPATGAFGPDTCQNGYVWREATPADHVCVTPATRTTTAQENTLAAGRRNPTGAYGSNTCVNGYVWREAYDGDVVCVTPDRRTLAHNDNAAAGSRVLGNSPAPAAKPAQCTYDGTSTTGTKSGSNPTRYQAIYSPALGARWDKCTHTVTIYWNADNTNTHFNVLVNGKQRELAGARGARQYSMPDSQFGEGGSTFAIQSCQRGGMFAPSVCTNWSPTVRVLVHVGSVSQG